MHAGYRPDPIRTTDHDGTPIVKVALDPHGNRWATIDAEDFDALPPAMSRKWLLNDNGRGYAYVKTCSPLASGRLVMISRVITGSAVGAEVAHDNGNRLDLRHRNLIMRVSKRAKRDHLMEVPGGDREAWSVLPDGLRH